MFVGAHLEVAEGGAAAPRVVALAPESIIGRMTSAALRVDDPRISEAHALISLRGDDLQLLALRGRVSVDGKPTSAVALTPGLRIVLAGFFPLVVRDVALPDRVPAVIPPAPGAPFPALGVVAFFPGDDAPLRHGFDPAAAAHLWSVGLEGATLRLRAGPVRDARDATVRPDDDRTITPGERFAVDGHVYSFGSAPARALHVDATLDRGGFDTALALHLQYDTVRVTSSHGKVCVFDGLQARALSELHGIGQPVAWQEVARALWGPLDAGDATETQIRQRWDQLLSRIRSKLREAGLRSDLVRTSRPGLVALVTGPRDTVIDAT